MLGNAGVKLGSVGCWGDAGENAKGMLGNAGGFWEMLGNAGGTLRMPGNTGDCWGMHVNRSARSQK